MTILAVIVIVIACAVLLSFGVSLWLISVKVLAVLDGMTHKQQAPAPVAEEEADAEAREAERKAQEAKRMFEAGIGNILDYDPVRALKKDGEA